MYGIIQFDAAFAVWGAPSTAIAVPLPRRGRLFSAHSADNAKVSEELSFLQWLTSAKSDLFEGAVSVS